MLSYTEHGKFPAMTQGHRAFCGAKSHSLDEAKPGVAMSTSSGPRVVPRCNGSPLRRRRNPANVARFSNLWQRRVCTMNFASDNTAPVAPAILEAIVEANRGYARGYGNDDWTRAVERRMAEIFEREVAVFLVPTR